ncbi:MAG TPA: DeoR/GlpR family DNA-binding transcription regulator [Candidatus Acidoferrales bacterium]|nr:DeoR/GlpR family DNA-binding transcription regulator [Candidatus Acidoferrales bacterium]HTS65265.1 DeoR/GlpR family DNA-binding transcription regulator [Candidatus Acidoferrales bacterium]
MRAAKERRLLVEERRRRILQMLEERGRVTVNELVGEFGVTTVTVRGDLDALAKSRSLQRSHGGAVRVLGTSPDYPVRFKEALHQEEKARIGLAAARLVKPDQTVILDSGTTTRAVARALKSQGPGPFTVITNSLDISMDLADLLQASVILVGGLLRKVSRSFVGPQAEQMMHQIHADHLFLGVDGITLDAGPSTPDILEAQLNALMVQAAGEVTIVCDASKFGRRSLSVICPMRSVRRVITDSRIPPPTVRELEQMGVEVIVA